MTESEVGKVALHIEKEMFSLFRVTDNRYKSKYRSIMFNLKDPKNQVGASCRGAAGHVRAAGAVGAVGRTPLPCRGARARAAVRVGAPERPFCPPRPEARPSVRPMLVPTHPAGSGTAARGWPPSRTQVLPGRASAAQGCLPGALSFCLGGSALAAAAGGDRIPRGLRDGLPAARCPGPANETGVCRASSTAFCAKRSLWPNS